MADIPRIKREQNLTAVSTPTTSATIPAPDTQVQEAVGKVLGVGLDYFHKQMEIAADDNARKGANDYQDEFNQGFNVGYDDKPGLKHIEGYDQFKVARDSLAERLNEKTKKLLSDPNISDYARKKLELKLDDATSTFQFYMDSQEGQVKIKEKAKQSQIEQDNLGGQLFGLMDTFNSKRENPLISSQIEKMKESYKTSLYGMGLADKVVTEDEDGRPQAKIVPSPTGEVQMKKDISEKIATSITELGNKYPMEAIAALKKYKSDILDTTYVRLEKSFKSTANLHEAYGEALKSTALDESPAEIQKKIKKYTDEGREDLAKSYYQYVTDISNKRETVSKNNSEIATNNALEIILGMENRPLSVEDALLDKDFKAWYDKILPKERIEFDKYLKPPRTTSVEALTDMHEFLMSGSSDRIKFNRLLSPLNKKARENAILRFNGVRTDLKGVDNSKINKKATTNAYIVKMYQLNRGSEDFYDNDDAQERIETESKLAEWIRTSNAEIPDVDSPEGLKNIEMFLEYHAKEVNKFPKFLGGKKRGVDITMNDADARAEADRIKRERAKK